MWLKTLNVTDAKWHTEDPHCGSIGHVLSFPESCELANKLGFNAVNLDLSFIRRRGSKSVLTLLSQHNLLASAFACSARINTKFSEIDFKESLIEFENDCRLAKESGYQRCVGFIQPSSNELDFYDHFKILSNRLKEIKPILLKNNIKLGLEFIGPPTMRVEAKYDFIHTIDGLRALIATADCKNIIGFKLDTMHWYASGAGLLDLRKMSPIEIIYIEIMDAMDGFDRLSVPEFSRKLPSPDGIIDVVGFLREINQLGYKGPIVVEPWNEEIKRLSCEEAAKRIKKSLDECMIAAGIIK